MSETTDKMRETAGLIARLITEQGKAFGVSECIVDDFGRYGNFSLICYLDVRKNSGMLSAYRPNNPQTFSLLKIAHLIKRVIKEQKDAGAIFRSHEAPQGVYRSNSCGGMRFKPDFEGYERSYVQIDLDFIPYNSTTNLFQGQTKYDGLTQEQSDQQLRMFE